MKISRASRGVVGVTVVFLVSCVNEPTGVLPSPPIIGATVVVANPNNVLSVVASVVTRDADSVAVKYKLFEADAELLTPAIRVAGDSAIIPLLGLLPARRYALRVVAYGPAGTALSDSFDFTTAPLPADLPQFTASGSDPSPGYIVFASGMYGVVIDNSGRVVWYRRFPNGPGLNFMAEPNGHYAARPMTPDPTDIEPWIEIDALGNMTRNMGCALGLQPRPHDLISELDGSYWLLCDETRTMDLSAEGGVAVARVTGTSVQHVSASGAILFQWSPFDHFSITDVALAERTGPVVNWTHGNALDLDSDGNLLVSFRNLDEITKIDVKSGSVVWRMGGRRNQFAFPDSPAPAFSHQHGARMSSPGRLILLDNIGNPNESRSERYAVDETTRTARLESSYGSIRGAITQIGGSVQSLPGGRTLVSFGTAGRVEEYDTSGRMTWSVEGNPGYVFRAQRIRSLYAPGAGTSR